MATYHKPDPKKVQALKDVANKMRIHSIQATDASNSGHPTSCCSAAEIMSVLFFNTMKYSVSEPRSPSNDRFVLSKGHACPILYAAWAEVGLFPVSELLNLRKINNDLEGHPTPRLNFIDVATGSLGQGLSCAAGMAYTGKYFDKANYRVFCVVGDGESAEGSIWEALHFSSHYKLDNMVCVFDINRLGQSEATSLQHDIDTYQRRLEAFGWHTVVVDGHNIESLCKAFADAETVKGKPTAIVAKTYKGKGIPGVEDQDNFHGKPMGKLSADAIAAIQARIVDNGPHGLVPPSPEAVAPVDISNARLASPPDYSKDKAVATRNAYGTALAKLGKANPRVIAMDGDTKNSTFAITFKNECPDRYVECFIAEQNLVGVAIGCATRDRTIAFVSTFAAFLTRAFDQIRMGAISQTNVTFVGSHAGISIGEDGPSQMALEDLGMFRSIPGATVFYPSDPVSCERAVELAANTRGVKFIRTSRPALPTLYSNDEVFQIGKAKVVRQSDNDQVTLVGCGVTLAEANKAAEQLASEDGINVRVIDPFTLKPFDAETVIDAGRRTGGRIITVEDHYPEGGIGEAVLSAVAEEKNFVVRKLAVRALPRSGKCAELLSMFAIDAAAIVKNVRDMLAA